MSAQQQEREALQQHDQEGAPKRPSKPKADNGDKAIAKAKQDAAKQQAASKAKQQPTRPKDKAEPKPSKPSLTATAKKHLEELTEQISKLEALKAERLAIMQKEHERGVSITEIAGPAGYSVARARQLLSK